jgi:hypothetical protein
MNAGSGTPVGRPRGYGYFNIRAGLNNFPAHRVAYQEFVGPIPDGYVIDHLCRNPPCCNPAHLEAVPFRVNLRRGLHGREMRGTVTHCPSGHPYDERNTYISPKGLRNCRKCNTAATVRYKARRKEQKRLQNLEGQVS